MYKNESQINYSLINLFLWLFPTGSVFILFKWKKEKIETTGRITHIQSLVANQQRLNKYIKNQITKILLVCRQKFEFFIYILIRLY